ncbi:hypothetical protein VN97_g1537 [Penicillium thymicola]|uniref:Uncharacterized protein n=1 Tax=Penicillium thymicola TaxID=293382 RepID=A0AAI9XC59_PENTH|nr:hypothetical protein VN97_g1537 [Penicillium thymicola]
MKGVASAFQPLFCHRLLEVRSSFLDILLRVFLVITFLYIGITQFGVVAVQRHSPWHDLNITARQYKPMRELCDGDPFSRP